MVKIMDTAFKTVVAVGGSLISFFFGGWSSLLTILAIFVAIDYATGVLAAAKEKKLNSNVGLWGIAKKVAMFVVIGVANLVDLALGGENSLFRDAATFFYLANELLSILENAGRLGVAIPDKLRGAVELLNGKGEQNGR